MLPTTCSNAIKITVERTCYGAWICHMLLMPSRKQCSKNVDTVHIHKQYSQGAGKSAYP